jgi:mono/diheme cytochrome c family protein
MRFSRRAAALVMSLVAGAAVAAGGSVAEQEGAALFARHCAICHGTEGKGDGAAASRFETTPADLTDGLVKFRSTPQGAAPLAADLVRTISDGSRGTAMVEWGSFLDAAQIESLAHYVLALEGYRDAPAGGTAPDTSPDELANAGPALDGGDLYQRFRCAVCHGEDRRGTGPAAPGLLEAEGRRTRVPDLNALPYKRGSDPVETAKTILHGMDGTPMASFAGAMTVEQALAISRWLIDSATVERRGFVGEEHLGFMIEMHDGGRMGMGGMHGMRGRHGMRHRRGMETRRDEE